MNVIEMTRELGKAIQQDERYIKFMKAVEDNDTDTEVQNAVGKFNQKRSELSMEMRLPDKNADKITELDREIHELYDEIMAMPKMKAFYEAKGEFDALMKSVNYILQMASNGEDPATCDATPPASCSGSCATCGGCG
ncbi:MAG: YlbF family regulator [Ruminococcus sp.]|nr:YlbF family regulator [Ruminococcus sp.]